MHPVYSDADAADQVLDWDHDDYTTLDARKWGDADLGTSATITYSFLGNGQFIDVDETLGVLEYGLTAAQEAIYEEGLRLIMDVADVNFVQLEGALAPFAGLMVQAWDNGGGRAPPRSQARDGEADLLEATTVNISNVNFNLRLALHETGHAIGLNHPGAYDGPGFNYDDDAHYFQDTLQYSILSYWAADNSGGNYGRTGSSTLMLHDVLALQKLYGANTTAFGSDTTYGFGSNTNRSPWIMDDAGDDMFGSIWDTGGHDLINLSFLDTDSQVDLRQGHFSSTGANVYNFSIAIGSVIEDLRTGDGDDRLDGNGAANALWGGDGDDTFYGRGGADSLFGGSGNDTFFGGAGGDTIDGGLARDAVDYASANGGMRINLTLGEAERLSGSSVDELDSVEDVHGSYHADVINGDARANYIVGRDGNDYVRARGYNDRIEGDSGNDTLFGGDGEDTIFGGTGDDLISGGSGNDHMDGSSGVDTVDYSGSNADWTIDLTETEATREGGISDRVIRFENILSGGGNDTLNGTSGINDLSGDDGDDLIRGYSGNDNLRGQGDNDTLFGGNGADLLIGGDGRDDMSGGSGNDLLRGGDGSDLLRGNSGQDRYQGGRGRDTVTFSDSAGPWVVDLEGGSALNGAGTIESLSSIENLIGSRGGDRLLGDNGANNLQGGRGNDTIGGRNGNDVILGDAGADVLTGGFGNDLISGGDGIDDMDGGGGSGDRIDYRYSNGAWTIDLEAETATSNSGTVESIRNFEHVFGARGNDTILGERGDNNLQGLQGNDSINGGEGDDVILGGSGEDSLAGGAGNDLINGGGGTDVMDGGTGIDRVDYSYSGSDWDINLAGSIATRVGGGSEVIRRFEHATGGRGDDTITGSDFGNVLQGGGGSDSLIGLTGADRLEGGANDDRLYGGTGNDRLYGGDGNDWFYGGEGQDDHYGGAGRDVFIFTDASHSVGLTRDVIRPGDRVTPAFEDGLDLISLAGIDANALTRGDDAFVLGGSGVGRLELRDSINGFTVVEGYTGVGRTADFLLLIEDGTRLASDYDVTDFIL